MRARGRRGGGFTLIEVMGALVIFSLGVLLTLGLTESMTEQLERAGIRSELTARARTALDSLEAQGFTALAPGSWTGHLTVRGRRYSETLRVAPFSPLVRELSVTLEPESGSGPRHTVTSYVSGRW